MLAEETQKMQKKKKIALFSPPLVFQHWKKQERERKSGEMGLFINEEWHEVNDDSYFKLVFDKNKKELKPGQLGIMKGLKHRQKSR